VSSRSTVNAAPGGAATATTAPAAPGPPYYRVEPGRPLRLADVDPDDIAGAGGKKQIAEALDKQRDRIASLQARLYAEQKQALLVILQAMDTGGKDGTVKHVLRGVNPQGCVVHSFKAPTAEELAHDFLWRVHAKVPPKGMIGIFNRSHYEDVLIARVKNLVPEAVWRPRYEIINDFERAVSQTGVTIVKFYLHISRAEQKRRLQARLDDPEKNWKFNPDDLEERKRWDDYQVAYEDALNSCSTPHAPWHVVPANSKRYRNLVVARTIADTLETLDPRYPEALPDLDKIEIPD
jgi:PPK2 family polyphosphate:nucleotide phosphotransferase